MKKRVRLLLVAAMMIMLCMAMLIGGTYALFSDTALVENHLEAGTLKVRLVRTKLSKTRLDNTTGYMIEEIDNDEVDFTHATSENVFGFEADELIVPTSSYEATMKISNVGSVAFTYSVSIKLNSESNPLAEQMHVYFDGTDIGYLSSFIEGERAVLRSGAIAKNSGSKTFTVKIVFEHTSGNNSAQRQKVDFDLIVSARQDATVIQDTETP